MSNISNYPPGVTGADIEAYYGDAPDDEEQPTYLSCWRLWRDGKWVMDIPTEQERNDLEGS
jgi:hypothetical protein